MKKLSKEAEAEILSAIQQVCDFVQKGDHPTAAVTKVAQARQLTPNFIKLACHGYNTGATAFQRESGESVLTKFAEFPLAVADDVIAAIYPKQPSLPGREKDAEAVSSEYSAPPKVTRLEKAAYVSLDPWRIELPASEEPVVLDHVAQRSVKKSAAEIGRMKKALEQARCEYRDAQDRLFGTLGLLAEHVKRSSNYSVGDIALAASSRYGERGAIVGRFLSQHVTKYACARRPRTGALRVDWDSEPFTHVTAAIKLAETVNRRRHEFRGLDEAISAKEAELYAPFEERETPILCKEAVLGFLTGAVATSLPKAFSGLASPADKEGLIAGAEADILDADAQNAIRSAQTQSTAAQLMDDEVIGGYDPDEVITAFNEISQLAPRASAQPLVMRALLRKRLVQGAIEPFEVSEIAGMEKTISEAQNPRLSTVYPTKASGEKNVLASRTVV